jgi:hypothetical protein
MDIYLMKKGTEAQHVWCTRTRHTGLANLGVRCGALSCEHWFHLVPAWAGTSEWNQVEPTKNRHPNGTAMSVHHVACLEPSEDNAVTVNPPSAICRSGHALPVDRLGSLARTSGCHWPASGHTGRADQLSCGFWYHRPLVHQRKQIQNHFRYRVPI